MPIFKINKTKVQQLSLIEDGFGSEDDLRDFFAENLEEILDVRFIAKEFQINYSGMDYFIDTIGIDENDSPVIIEYKWKEEDKIFAQGKLDLNWLMKNKQRFDLIVKEKFKTEPKWEQPRVILIAQGFSRHLIGAVQQEKNIELKSYTCYKPDILKIEDIYIPTGIKTGKKNGSKREIGKYNLEYHFKITSPEMRKITNALRSKILELPNVKENFGKVGIYYKTTKSFARLEFRPTWIQLLIREPHYKNDIKKIIKDITKNKWWYRGMIKFTPDSNLDYIFSIIRASYNSTL